jgi:hypothetical protein
MNKKAPSRAGRGRRAKFNCESCCFGSRFSQRWQALCRLFFLQALIDRVYPTFERGLSLRLDAALEELEGTEGRRRGGPVPVGLVVGRIMVDLERRRIDPGYLGARHGG